MGPTENTNQNSSAAVPGAAPADPAGMPPAQPVVPVASVDPGVGVSVPSDPAEGVGPTAMEGAAVPNPEEVSMSDEAPGTSEASVVPVPATPAAPAVDAEVPAARAGMPVDPAAPGGEPTPPATPAV